MIEHWKAEFAEALEQLPCWFSPAIRPRLFFLPSWWPAHYGAWAFLHMVFIGPGLLDADAPDDVCHYVIGHEYGHLYLKHTLLQLAYIVGFLTYFAGGYCHLLAPLIGGGIILMSSVLCAILWTTFANNLEYQADDLAATLFGRESALAGSLWTAERAGTINNKFRKGRLRRLGWTDQCVYPKNSH